MRYASYVTPESEKVKSFAKDSLKDLKKCTKKQKLEKVCGALASILNLSLRISGIQLPDITLETRRGSCLSYAALLCSILRSIGFSHMDVFVSIGADEYRKYHAWVIVNLGEGKNLWILIDPTKLDFQSLHFGNLVECIQWHQISHIYWFNDKWEKFFVETDVSSELLKFAHSFDRRTKKTY